MSIINGFKEESAIKQIIQENNLYGSKIYFDESCSYKDEDGKEFALEFLVQSSNYTDVLLSVNGGLRRLREYSLPIITIAYLKMKKYERDFLSS